MNNATEQQIKTRLEEIENRRQPVYIGKRKPDNPYEGLLWVDTLEQSLKSYIQYNWITLSYIQPSGSGIVRHTGAPTIEIDWSQGKVHSAQITSATTFTFKAPADGGRYLLIIKEGGSGGYTPTLPANVHWVGNVTPTFVTTVNTHIIISFVYSSVSDVYFAINSDGYV